MSARRPKGGQPRWPKNWLTSGKRQTILTHSARETGNFGQWLAGRIPVPCLILLEGELGAGKTTLAKGIVQGLGAAREEDVTSPTFSLIHEYGGSGEVYHIDLYRIESARELGTLGLDDILSANAVVLVEWAEKLGTLPPENVVRIRLEYAGGEDRRISCEGVSANKATVAG